MTAVHANRTALVTEAQRRYDQYLQLATRAICTESRWAKRRAAILAVEAVSLLPDLIAELQGCAGRGGDAA